MPSFFIPYPPVLILSTGTNQTTSNASVTITSGIPPLLFAESARMCNAGTRGIDNGAGV